MNANKMYRPVFLLMAIVLIASSLACKLATTGIRVAQQVPAAGLSTPAEAATATSLPLAETVAAPLTPQPTLTPEPTSSPTTPPSTWLVMVYQDADDAVLEKDSYIDLNEMELAGPSDRVQIIVQIDRYKGEFSGGGNWTSTKRFRVLQDSNLDNLASEQIADLGEMDSGNAQTLIDFAVWAIQNYPAGHYVLILSDHGSGWPGGFSDDDPVENSKMRTNQIDRALGEIINQTGIGQFEIVGMDACLMAQLEVFSALAPYARYGVASEEVEPALGWAYASFLRKLVDNPDMSGADLARAMVEGYITEDVRVVDPQARAQLLQDIEEPASTSQQELAEKLMLDVTMSAVRLAAMTDIHLALNDLSMALSGVNQSDVARARAYARSYTSVFTDYPPSYLDLAHFAGLAQDTFKDNGQINDAAARLQTAISSAVVAEKHGAKLNGSYGISFSFPNSNLYQWTSDPSESLEYISIVSRFAAASLWDDFLAYHYTGRRIDPASVDPSVLAPIAGAPVDPALLGGGAPPEGPVTAPGAGSVTLAPIQISATQFPASQSVTLSSVIQGNNIAYVYFAVLLYDPGLDELLIADIEFVEQENNRVVNGVVYPDWGQGGQVALEYTWNPTVYNLSNGQEDTFALFQADTYGADSANTFYQVQGTFTFASDGKKVPALLYFNAQGKMTSAWGDFGAGGVSSWRQLTPAIGDQFTVTEKWYSFKNNPNGEFVYRDGGTLTFNGQPFTWTTYYPAAGEWVLGFAVEDLDGNISIEYVEVTITER